MAAIRSPTPRFWTVVAEPSGRPAAPQARLCGDRRSLDAGAIQDGTMSRQVPSLPAEQSSLPCARPAPASLAIAPDRPASARLDTARVGAGRYVLAIARPVQPCRPGRSVRHSFSPPSPSSRRSGERSRQAPKVPTLPMPVAVAITGRAACVDSAHGRPAPLALPPHHSLDEADAKADRSSRGSNQAAWTEAARCRCFMA